MIDANHLKAHRTAASLLKKGPVPRRIGRTKGGPKPCYCLRRNIATLRRHPANQPQRHRQACQPKKPCRTNSAPATMTAINTSFPNVSGAILSRICYPTYMPSTTGNIAAVEIETSSQLNWRLAVRRIASEPAETTRYSDASFVNAFPRRSLCKQKDKNKRSRHRWRCLPESRRW